MKKISSVAINVLKEALTNIYWYKADLVSFLRHTLSNPSILTKIDTNGYKRNIVTTLVDYMAGHEDIYQGDLLKLMTETAKFVDFSHLQQLEDGDSKVKKAQDSVGALKKLIAVHQSMIDAQEGIQEKIKNSQEISLRKKGVREKLAQINKEYTALFQLTPHIRGFALEKIVNDLFELFDLDPKASFKITGEQIDGAFTFDSTDYLFECKWHSKPISSVDLDIFKGKLSRKLDNTLGLLLSINGYSEDAVAIHSLSRGTILLMDGLDLMAVLEERIDLPQLLLRKRKHASQTGEIYLKISEIL